MHLVTDDEVLARPDLGRWIPRLLEAGGGRLALHVRGPRTPARTLVEIVRQAVQLGRATGSRVIINDRVDVALALGADGAQLGARALPLAVARRIAPALALGVSVHGVAEAEGGRGADWLLGGTIWPTASHPGEAGGGVDHLRALVAAATPPVVAIGGITPARVHEARAAGAAGVAVVRGIWAAADPVEALSRYLSAWRES